ncbi:MAG: hypothetical protein ACXWQ5_22745, partial [Ktedonobacterales bacterium]
VEMATNIARQLGMRRATEDRKLTHERCPETRNDHMPWKHKSNVIKYNTRRLTSRNIMPYVRRKTRLLNARCLACLFLTGRCVTIHQWGDDANEGNAPLLVVKRTRHSCVGGFHTRRADAFITPEFMASGLFS